MHSSLDSKPGQLVRADLHEVLVDLGLCGLISDAGAGFVWVMLQRHFAVGCMS